MKSRLIKSWISERNSSYTKQFTDRDCDAFHSYYQQQKLKEELLMIEHKPMDSIETSKQIGSEYLNDKVIGRKILMRIISLVALFLLSLFLNGYLIMKIFFSG